MAFWRATKGERPGDRPGPVNWLVLAGMLAFLGLLLWQLYALFFNQMYPYFEGEPGIVPAAITGATAYGVARLIWRFVLAKRIAAGPKAEEPSALVDG